MMKKVVVMVSIQNTESVLSMNNRNLPYDCMKGTSKVTHSIGGRG